MKHVLLIIGLLILFIPTEPSTPTPIPDPDVPPAPVVVTKDVFDIASDMYRILLSDAFDEYASSTFDNDEARLKFIEEHTHAARISSFTDFNKQIQTAVKDNKVSEFAKALRAKELE